MTHLTLKVFGDAFAKGYELNNGIGVDTWQVVAARTSPHGYFQVGQDAPVKIKSITLYFRSGRMQGSLLYP